MVDTCFPNVVCEACLEAGSLSFSFGTLNLSIKYRLTYFFSASHYYLNVEDYLLSTHNAIVNDDWASTVRI